MAKLIPLDEAATMLGVSTEKLNEMRARNEISGYRDGSTWKFKESELERVASQLGLDVDDGEESSVKLPLPGSSGERGSAGDIDAELDELVDVSALDLEESSEDTDGPDSVLVSEQELGRSDSGASSTIIGRNALGSADADLELRLPEDEESSEELVLDLGEQTGESDVQLVDSGSALPPAPATGSSSELRLEGDASPGDSPTAGSQLDIAADSKKAAAAGSGGSAASKSALQLDAAGAGSEINLAGLSSELNLIPGSDVISSGSGVVDKSGSSLDAGGSEISLEDASDFDLASSGIDLDMDGSGSDVKDSGVDSDVTLSSGDSGINLTSPSDSGISLEDTPPELGAGSGIEALELGEADIIDLGEEAVELDDATVQSDDDFLLTPVESMEGLEDADSGSQVIALDTEEIDGEDATVIAEGGAQDGLEEDSTLGPVAPLGPTAVGSELGYTIWNVVGLGICVFMLALGGMMTADLVRNMWSWQGEFALNSQLMDAILGIFGG